MAGCVLECCEPVGKPFLLPAPPAGGQCGRGTDKASEYEGANAAKETAYTAFPVAHQRAFLSIRPARRSAFEKLPTITLATSGWRVKDGFDSSHSPFAEIDARLVHVQTDVGATNLGG
jgi:hypothetical protein